VKSWECLSDEAEQASRILLNPIYGYDLQIALGLSFISMELNRETYWSELSRRAS
jgi:hypothetical protein